MKPEEQLLLACTRQYFSPAHQREVANLSCEHELDWNVVCSTALLHGVAPLVYANLLATTLNIPQEAKNQLRASFLHNLGKKGRQAKTIDQALSFCRREGFDVMLIKGAALDVVVYDEPWYTTSQDIDLVVRPTKEEIGDELGQEIGHFFHETGIEYDFFEHHDIAMNGILSVDFSRIWNDATQIQIKDLDAYVMAPEDMLISACINSCRKRFFRLKSLCDIAEIIDRYPDLQSSDLVCRARAHGCQNIVYTALLVTKMTVGCEISNGVLAQLEPSSLRTKIIQQMIPRMSLQAYSSLYSGRNVLDRRVDSSLALSYVTLDWQQIWRRIHFVFRSGNDSLM